MSTSLVPDRPLAVVVTPAGQDSVSLSALARRAVPMLVNPESYAEHSRRSLAQCLLAALELITEESASPPRDRDVPPEGEPEYEPGEWLGEALP